MDIVAISGTASAIIVVLGGLWKIRKEAVELAAQRDKDAAQRQMEAAELEAQRQRDREDLAASKAAAELESRSVAVEAAEKAVGVVRSVMETQTKTVEDLQTRVTDQDTRITDQGKRLTRQSERITDMSRRHTVAIGHIAEREDAAEEHMGQRPAWLPAVPDLIRPDVDEVRRPPPVG